MNGKEERLKKLSEKVIFISGGGTGGHIYPALAIANRLYDHSFKVFYIGNPKNLEYKIFKHSISDISFLPISITGMPRKFSFGFINWIFKLNIAIIKSVYYFLKYRPLGLFTTGGYVSAAPIIASILTKVPYVMHDSDAIPGLVSRVFSKYAKVVNLNYSEAKQYIKCKEVTVLGNPLREVFLNCNDENYFDKLGLDKNKLIIFAMGGSQGARTINYSILPIIKKLINTDRVQIIIQTGQKNYEDSILKLKEFYPNYDKDKNLIIKPYFDNIHEILATSDLVISRAGSLSLSEINATSTAAILIPYPKAASNHQMKNAQAQKNSNAAVIISDQDCNSETLYNSILDLINNKDKINTMKFNSCKLSKPKALDNIIKTFLIAIGEEK